MKKEKKEPTIHPTSYMTVEQQTSLYRVEMGSEKTQANIRLQRLALGQCVCEARKVKFDWTGTGRKSTRIVHDESCPRWKRWMSQTTAVLASFADANSEQSRSAASSTGSAPSTRPEG